MRHEAFVPSAAADLAGSRPVPRGPGRTRGRPSAGAPASALLLAAALAAGACSGAPRIELGTPTVQASSSFTGVCAIFVRIENPGDAPDALLRAAVDYPGAITELHDVKDGKMIRRERIAIGARSAVALGPGGPHIMVFNLPPDAAAGRAITLRLVFERSGEKVTSVRIGG
jgi:copper(I)-binding protein